MKTICFRLITCALFLGSVMASANDESSGEGIVVETMDVGSYVYVRLEESDTWVASASVPVAAGDHIQYSNGSPMKNFYSAKLDRTFEDILFAMSIRVVNSNDQPPTEKEVAAAHQQVPASHVGMNDIGAPAQGDVPPLEGGMTVAEVLAGYPHGEGQAFSVRAKVMKVSMNIMGKNWITLQDGTRTEWADRLIATSQESVKIGETVVVNGVVANDVSLGYGYDYKVLLEDARITR